MHPSATKVKILKKVFTEENGVGSSSSAAAACSAHASVKSRDTSTSKSATPSTESKSNGNSSSSLPRSHRICDSILDVIGETPLVRLNRIGKPDYYHPTSHENSSSIASSSSTMTTPTTTPLAEGVELLVKCEYFNAGGSVKDRIGRQMLEDAEAAGTIRPGDTLIEPTSGNTGIGIALAAAVKGYQCIITMPEKMSKEKVDVLKALGAEIIRTPTEAAFDAPDSHISVARRLQEDTERSHILDQYKNPSNPAAHYNGTAEELLRQCDGKIDMLVAGVGTGGTLSGIAKRLKEHNPNIIVVGVDPVGSILALPDSLNDDGRLDPYLVEGIGYDFIPKVLDRKLVDVWYKSNDVDSLIMMRKLIRYEGLLCGGSSGSAVCAALHVAANHPTYRLQPGQRCVIILPDSVRNYMTKGLSDDWMSDHGFVDGDIIAPKNNHFLQSTWWASKRVYEMAINTPLTITSDVKCRDAIALLKRECFDMVPVLSSDGAVIGVVTEGNITKCILSGRCDPKTTIADSGVIYKTFHKFAMHSTLHELAQALDHDPFVLIVTEQRCFSTSNHHSSATKRPRSDSSVDSMTTSSTPVATVTTRSVVSGIVSRIDLLDFISHGDPSLAVTTDPTIENTPVK